MASAIVATPAFAQDVTLSDSGTIPTVVHGDGQPLSLAAAMLAGDLEHVTGAKPRLSAKLDDCAATCVVIARRGSGLLDAVVKDTGIDASALAGQWERYLRVALPSRSHAGRRYLVIAGSDTRGAIWGTVDLTREMGVSAWEWWADVTPRRRSKVVVDGGLRLSDTPSVQYRGIFLNDEDWGLQPWAAKTFEPEVGDIGPKTYGRIYELMWRLKANLIWPAMHESTKPFYQVAGNAEAARDHAIVVGTSHAEPLMRNNVREWDEAKQGPFNFFTNRDAMVRYWRDRAQAVKGFDNVYSVGLRGKHDSEMEGASSPTVARDALAEAIGVQRDLLSQAQTRPATAIPQALTLYKEVLDLYALGLKVPDDVTLVWPEDNYGYINQLPTPQEQARGGGSGLYYHISYWGRPHDYLWLATTHPALIREQLDRAWTMGAHKIWMVNVGDIKPGEYLTQYFLDAAFDHETLNRPAKAHLADWASAQFGEALGRPIADILTDYYDLAFERRPEFIGFSQVEPITPIRIGDYVRSGGGEAQQRIDRYAELASRADALASRIPADRRDAYFELVLYPVRGAANLNTRNLKLDLAALYARQGRPVANLLSDEARAAHARIVADTETYNRQAGGKWRNIMDMAPRRLPVFAEPAYPKVDFPEKPGCAIDDGALQFVSGRPASHALTIYSWGKPLEWSLDGATGLQPGASRGRLQPANGYQQRIALSYDGNGAIKGGSIRCGDQTFPVSAILATPGAGLSAVEVDRIVSLPATEASTASGDWERIAGLGSHGALLRSRLNLPSRKDEHDGAPLVYTFEATTGGDANLVVEALPVHALTSANRLRVAVRVDDGPARTLDFDTHGRSDEWKQNVLSNSAKRTLFLSQLAKGSHSIRIVALDPGFLLDRIDVRFDGAPDLYGAPATR
ncbi:hypothetical protein AWL63_14375 [Sphingomonas panacis]|uniref:Gylcosyl hydrolase 115 C-terminal domain-containing protein n=1 Tax=Sphingomonas panacis TaxID=1560345 RepID=A0A1B3ZHD6_9SPHN|nr:hypothetical protein AWL63_14375 [Sphingomonas panacis]